MLNLNKRKQIFFLANNLNMPLGIVCITDVHKILIRGMLIFSARYDDSTPIKCKTCFAAYPAVNLNASIMLCSHNTFTSTISYRLHFTNHKFHHHTSDDGTINPNFFAMKKENNGGSWKLSPFYDVNIVSKSKLSSFYAISCHSWQYCTIIIFVY